MKIETLRDLKNMLNTIDDNKALDKTIKYCFESEGYGTICEGAWFDLQCFSYKTFPTITICESLEDVCRHEGRTPWTSLSRWLEEEED